MNSRENKLLKNTLIIGIGNFSSKILVFLLLPFYTHYLTTEEYGYYDLIISIVALIIPIISFLIYEGVYRYILDEDDSNRREVFISTSLFILIRNLLIANSIFIIVTIFYEIKYAYLILIYLNVFAISEMFMYIARGLKQNLHFSIAGLLNTFLNLMFNIVLIIIFQYRVEALLISLIVGQIASILYLEIKLKIITKMKLRIKVEKDIKHKLITYSIPLIPNIVNWWVISASDRFMLTYFIGVEANGIYAIANKFPSILMLINNIFYLAWQESAITEYKSVDKNGFYSRMFEGYMKFQFSILIVLFAFSPLMVDILLNQDYKEAYKYMPFLYLAIVFKSFSSFYGTGFQSSKDTKGAYLSSIIGTIVNLYLNFILIPFWGIQGAAISTMISFFIMWIVRLVQTKKYFIISIKKSLVIPFTFILIIYMYVYYINDLKIVTILSMILSLFSVFLLNKSMILKILKMKRKARGN